MKRFLWGAALVLTVLFPGAALAQSAEEFYCEVLSLKGQVTASGKAAGARALRQGDLVAAGEEVQVGEDAYVDLAYDSDWQNVTRLEANTKIKVAAIAQGRLDLAAGGVFAKFKKLPQNSSFEIRTPTAVASVRGTEYRTTFLDGKTDVYNASPSKVYVYAVTADGTVDRENALILREAKKTRIEEAGSSRPKPMEMSPEEKAQGLKAAAAIKENIDKAVGENRQAKIQSLAQIEEFIRESKRKTHALPEKPVEFSRVTDERRRPFSGGERQMAPPEPPPAPDEPAAPETPAVPPAAENA